MEPFTRLVFIFVSSAILWLFVSPEVTSVRVSMRNDGVLSESITKLYYMNQVCFKSPSLIQIRGRTAVRVSPWSSNLPPPTATCVAGVETFDYQNFRLTLTFKALRMSPGNGTAGCVRSRLDLYNGRIPSPANALTGRQGVCGNHVSGRYFTTSSNFILLKFSTYRLPPHTYENFEAVVTPYHTGSCQSDEFRCTNARCVSDHLMCDGYNNCGDDSDERDCSSLALPLAAIIGIVVGGAIFIVIVVIVVVWRCRQTKGAYDNI